MTEAAIQLCAGRVAHARLRPFVHRFVYRVFCLRLRVDQPELLVAFNSALFGVNRRRPVSFMSADHGARDGSDLMTWLRGTVESAGLSMPEGAVWLQCFPRIFGYVFNPVSFWFLHDAQGQLRVLVAEVNNTFGQRHQYVLRSPDGGPIVDGVALSCAKEFHVSPFCAVSGRYEFQLDTRAQSQRVSIDYFDPVDEPVALLRTAIVVQSAALSTRLLLRELVRAPLMTLGVIVRIHLQALRLWRKGAAYHPIPPQSKDEVSSNAKVPL